MQIAMVHPILAVLPLGGGNAFLPFAYLAGAESRTFRFARAGELNDAALAIVKLAVTGMIHLGHHVAVQGHMMMHM